MEYRAYFETGTNGETRHNIEAESADGLMEALTALLVSLQLDKNYIEDIVIWTPNRDHCLLVERDPHGVILGSFTKRPIRLI